MKYFDNKTLQQYFDSKRHLKVCVDAEVYSISDLKDLSDPTNGVAYNEFGAAHYFDYRDVEKIIVGNTPITVDMIQSKPPEEKESKPKEEPAPEDEAESEPPEEKPPSKKEPDLSWFSPMYDIGRSLIAETKRKKRNV